MSAELKQNTNSGHAPDNRGLPAWLELVRQHVESLKFGAVQITVHDSKVTQVERLEKVRLDRPQ